MNQNSVTDGRGESSGSLPLCLRDWTAGAKGRASVGSGQERSWQCQLAKTCPKPSIKMEPSNHWSCQRGYLTCTAQGGSLSLWLLQERQLGFPGGRNPTFNWLTSSSVPTVGLPLLQSCLVGGIKFFKKDRSFFLPRIYFAFIIQLYFEWGGRNSRNTFSGLSRGWHSNEWLNFKYVI